MGFYSRKKPKTGLFTLPGALFKSGVALARIRYIILNFPALDFLVRKIKEREFQKSLCCSLPYFYTYLGSNLLLVLVTNIWSSTRSTPHHVSRLVMDSVNLELGFWSKLSEDFFNI